MNILSRLQPGLGQPFFLTLFFVSGFVITSFTGEDIKDEAYGKYDFSVFPDSDIPTFRTPQNENVTAQQGYTVYLNCEINNLNDYSVSNFSGEMKRK